MSEVQNTATQLIDRLAALGEKDRDAVLSRMAPEERGDVENALSKYLEKERLEEERQQRIDQQFLGYSPWLASIVEDAQEGTASGLSETCSVALWDIHSTKVGDGMSTPRTGWQSFVERFNEWLSPAGSNAAATEGETQA
ncbi:MAG: hypothetical protein ABJO05_07300 [Roseibium sp.]